VERGAEVVFHDPVVTHLPKEIAGKFKVTSKLTEALSGSDLVVVASGWPMYREEVHPKLLEEHMRRVVVLDQTGFLAARLDGVSEVMYITVGRSWSNTR
jgi:UDP-N-acetyl-D-mannosaminuronate dehydrogenase